MAGFPDLSGVMPVHGDGRDSLYCVRYYHAYVACLFSWDRQAAIPLLARGVGSVLSWLDRCGSWGGTRDPRHAFSHRDTAHDTKYIRTRGTAQEGQAAHRGRTAGCVVQYRKYFGIIEP